MKSWRCASSCKSFARWCSLSKGESLDIYPWLVVAVLGITSGIFAQSVQAFELERGQKTGVTGASNTTTRIKKLSETDPSINVKDLLSQSSTPNAQSPVQITSVKANPTEKGVEVILETTLGDRLQVANRSAGNNFIADITGGQLRLPNGDAFTFRSEKPLAGITEILVTNIDTNTVRVTVVGEKVLPAVELFDDSVGLIFAIPSTTTATQNPTPNPDPQTERGEETPQKKPTAQQDDAIELVVTGEGDGYRVQEATTGTRTDTPVRDIPQSIQVIPQQIIRDQQVVKLEEALTNVSGLIYGGTDTATETRFSIRGFDNAPILIDGFKQYTYPGVPEVANLERVEVLKGPASILYGEIQPGGVINAVTKKPLSKPFYEVEFQAGNNGFLRPRIDFSAPLTTDGKVRYRLNALYQNSNSFRNFDENIERVFVAPVVTAKIGDNTDLTLDLQYSNSEQPYDSGTLAIGNRVINIPRNRIIGEPDDSIQRDLFNIGYTLEHRFNNNWKINNAFRYRKSGIYSEKLTIPTFFDEATGLLSRVYAFDDFDAEDYSLQTNIVGKFATGSIQHTLLFGVDYNHSNSNSFATATFFTPSEINVFDPVYRTVPRGNIKEALVILDGKAQSDRIGVYLQDQIALSDTLKVLAGLRYDTVKQTTLNEPVIFTPDGNDITQDDSAWTPRFGIVYQPIKEVSLYASYSKSFNPSASGSISSNGEPLKPEQGKGYEVGVKTELLNEKLSATLAYFDVTKQNVATPDPNFPGLGFVIAAGEQRSQGVELDVSGQISPGWNIIASYAYTDAEITKDNAYAIGNKLVGIPRHSASLWTTYEFQKGNLQGLGLGVGINYVGEREGDLDNSFKLDSYFLTNAAIFYRRDNWKLALNFKNLFDINYYPGTPFGRTSLTVGEPFTMIGSVSITF
jgi:iron complex outermembrane recepter protein